MYKFSQLVGYILDSLVWMAWLIYLSIVCVSKFNYFNGEIGCRNLWSNLVCGGYLEVDDVYKVWPCAFVVVVA